MTNFNLTPKPVQVPAILSKSGKTFQLYDIVRSPVVFSQSEIQQMRAMLRTIINATEQREANLKEMQKELNKYCDKDSEDKGQAEQAFRIYNDIRTVRRELKQKRCVMSNVQRKLRQMLTEGSFE